MASTVCFCFCSTTSSSGIPWPSTGSCTVGAIHSVPIRFSCSILFLTDLEIHDRIRLVQAKERTSDLWGRNLQKRNDFDLLRSPLRQTFRTSGSNRGRGRSGISCSPHQRRRQFFQGCPKSIQLRLDLVFPSDRAFFCLSVLEEAATSAVRGALCTVPAQRYIPSPNKRSSECRGRQIFRQRDRLHLFGAGTSGSVGKRFLVGCESTFSCTISFVWAPFVTAPRTETSCVFREFDSVTL